MYIYKADRENIKMVERCIADVMGIDSDTYIDAERVDIRTKIARYSWIYYVYKLTLLTHEQIAEMINRNQSNVSRAINNVETWLKKPKRKEHQFIKFIDNEIKSKTNTKARARNTTDYTIG